MVTAHAAGDDSPTPDRAGRCDRRIAEGSRRHDHDAAEVSVRHEWDRLSGTGTPSGGAVKDYLAPIILLARGSIHGSLVLERVVASGTVPCTAGSCGRTDLAATRHHAAGPP